MCIASERVLLIRKARGPYTGMLNLSGGGIEFGEESGAALRREFIKETGLAISRPSLAAGNVKMISIDFPLKNDRYYQLFARLTR